MAKTSRKEPAKSLGPWRVDGISPEAVAAATEAAARAGMPLEVWLSRLIRETDERERRERQQVGRERPGTA